MHDPDLDAEKELLTRLDSIKDPASMAPEALVRDFTLLVRAYKRKRAEARDYYEHLDYIRKFLKEAWDEDEEYFDPNYVENRTPGHWCPTMIEELDEMLEPGTVWMPL